MIQELLNSAEPAGQKSWTSEKTLFALTILAMFGVVFIIGIVLLIPEIAKTLGFAILGLGGVILSVIAVIVLLYNFWKMLRDLGFL